MTSYLSSVRKQFSYYKGLGEKAIHQIEPAQLFWRPDPTANSIAIIVHHMYGNMQSRWTDFLTSDGEKTWRKREAEFEPEIVDKSGLIQEWETGWTTLFSALDGLTEDHLGQIIYIRNQGHSVVEAINRQLAHYAYHTGQIVYLARMLKGDTWKSLSIPRGGSQAYNAKKFAQEKGRRHFTDEWLEDK